MTSYKAISSGKYFIVSFFLFLVMNCNVVVQSRSEIKKGFLELTRDKLESRSLIHLNGNWKFFQNQYLNSDKIEPQETDNFALINVPGTWPKSNKFGYGTYQLRLYLPNSEINQSYAIYVPVIFSAYRLYVNGREIGNVGKPGKDFESERPLLKTIIRNFPVESNWLDITIEISNFHHREGGMVEILKIGREEAILYERQFKGMFEFFLFGVILVMAIYHFILYYLRRENISYLFFSIYAISMALRILFTGEKWICDLFPSISWNVIRRGEYLSLTMVLISSTYFFVEIFSQFNWKKSAILSIPAILYSLIVLFTQPLLFSEWLIYFQIYTAILIAYLVFLGVKALLRKDPGIAILLAGGIVLGATGINDILHTQQMIYTANYSPLGLFIFIIAQSYALAKIQADTYRSLERVTIHLKKTNAAYERFVPHKFLRLLGKDDIVDVRLGNHVKMDLTVFFTDIRDFTTLSEKMTPEENFAFLNTYLDRVGPVIRRNNGFIDKYIGDGIMALFQNEPDHAIQAAVEMQEMIRIYNQDRIARDYDPIRVGVGIHQGSLMLGTIGESGRMDATVISDAVNLCSRIEGLTKLYGSNILISDYTYQNIAQKDRFHYRHLGRVCVKGKKRSIGIYEIINGDHPEQMELKIKTKPIFDNGIENFNKNNFSDAAKYFAQVLVENPEDRTAECYKNYSELYQKGNFPKDENGFPLIKAG